MLRGGPFVAELTEEEAEAFMRPVKGEGGFQSLLRVLQKKFDKKARTVKLEGDEIEKINRYTGQYGAGGFEDRLAGLRRDLPKLVN